MFDDLSPPGWLPRPGTWPYWMPNSLWDRSPPARANSATPSIPGGGILGDFGQANDIWDVGTSGLLGSVLRPKAGDRPLGHLEQLNNAWNRRTASSLRSVGPPSAYNGILGDFALPVDESWPAVSRPTAWDTPTPPIPTTLPPMFPPMRPPEHLNSAKFWGVAPASAGVNEPPPAHGFSFPAQLQAPSGESVPTYPTDRAPQSSVGAPGPTSWATPVAPLEYLGSAKFWGSGPRPSGTSEQPLALDFQSFKGTARAELGLGGDPSRR